MNLINLEKKEIFSMLDKVKILMDENTEQALNNLKNNFDEVLRPLKVVDNIDEKIECLKNDVSDNTENTKRQISNLIKEFSKQRDFIEEQFDGLNDNLKKMNEDLGNLQKNHQAFSKELRERVKALSDLICFYGNKIENIHTMLIALLVMCFLILVCVGFLAIYLI